VCSAINYTLLTCRPDLAVYARRNTNKSDDDNNNSYTRDGDGIPRLFHNSALLALLQTVPRRWCRAAAATDLTLVTNTLLLL